MEAYYNEFDAKPAAWLMELIRQGHITPGTVDETSIKDLKEIPDGFTRAHFFAGLGGWEQALKLAGWNPAWPVWTGSCPCQPFSSAGKGLGEADPRHLWPDFRRLIAHHRPPIIFGEQVSSKLGREWLAGVFADLEALGYETGGADLCAAGEGAPHIRQRLYWVAYLPGAGHQQRKLGDKAGAKRQTPRGGPQRGQRRGRHDAADGGLSGEGLAHVCGSRPQGHPADRGGLGATPDSSQRFQQPQRHGEVGQRLGDLQSAGLQGQRSEHHQGGGGSGGQPGSAMQAGCPSWNGPTGFVECSDGTRRASLEPGAFPLAHGVPARVGRLRGYGNAIVPQVAATFIKAVMEYIDEPA